MHVHALRWKHAAIQGHHAEQQNEQGRDAQRDAALRRGHAAQDGGHEHHRRNRAHTEGQHHLHGTQRITGSQRHGQGRIDQPAGQQAIDEAQRIPAGDPAAARHTSGKLR